MKFKHVEQVAVFYEPQPGRRQKVGRLAFKDHRALFEYDGGFLASKIELSPFHLRLQPGVFEGDARKMDGLMGVFDDSLPDGWGRLLIDRRAVELGLSAAKVTPLDRLTLVGSRSMGALVYEPEVSLDEPTTINPTEFEKEVETVLKDMTGANLERLIAMGGSPKGARPKLLVQLAPDGAVYSGSRTTREGFSSWLIKFPAAIDHRHAGALEHAYFMMAERAGIAVPRTQLLAKTKRHPGYFAIERFDRVQDQRVHMHTAGGLLHLPNPYPALDYADLIKLTRRLVRNEVAVTEMFRRACFNVFAHNRDDHPRNFAFLMTEDGAWNLSPAYDLTFAEGPRGEHTTLVAGEGPAPGMAALRRLAKDTDVKNSETVIDRVRDAVASFAKFADEAGVPAKLRASTAKAISAALKR